MKIALLIFSLSVWAQPKAKINYKYKKYEKFDFSAIDVDGDLSSPGDLSANSRLKKKFKNRLPERKNFNRELIRNLDIVR